MPACASPVAHPDEDSWRFPASRARQKRLAARPTPRVRRRRNSAGLRYVDRDRLTGRAPALRHEL